jgi:hypothetical protein
MADDADNRFYLKGRAAREFLVSVFFSNQLQAGHDFESQTI